MSISELSKSSITRELNSIGTWWLNNTFDNTHGGFVGEINSEGVVVEGVNKGIVQNSRILWFYSEKALFSGEAEYRRAAKRAFDYLLTHFDDIEFGGAIWEISPTGQKVNGKKQTYALSFCIYAFCAYYKLTGCDIAKGRAKSYFDLIEKYARDREFGGYIEAFTQQWQSLDDLRLSNKDLNSPKSMNTHLHVLEAYSALYAVLPNPIVKEALEHVLDMFKQHIINHETKHLRLFFDNQWRDQSNTISYGHDIEASWLLWEAVDNLDDKSRCEYFKPLILAIAEICLDESIGLHGQVCDEFEFANNHRHEDSHWWVQAEALVGFLNAYYLTQDSKYLEICKKIWLFIQRYHIDDVAGEWHWNSTLDDKVHYKAGFWKAPYHNGRAMMEVCKLLDSLNEV